MSPDLIAFIMLILDHEEIKRRRKASVLYLLFYDMIVQIDNPKQNTKSLQVICFEFDMSYLHILTF